MVGILTALLIAAAAAGDTPRLLAGRLSAGKAQSVKWSWAGAWLWPVGDSLVLGGPVRGTPPFHVLRGLVGPKGEGHQGADIGNGRGGDLVRAAAAGLVVYVEADTGRTGYGRHVVIAHRMPGEGAVYSVYAHLRKGSIRVSAGQTVGPGKTIARVGRSGRATTNHLHFEVRRVRDPYERWEHQPILDPLTFVAGRLPGHRADSSWPGPYLSWAELHGVIPRDQEGGEALRRGAWWRMMALAARSPMESLPADPESLRSEMIRIGLLAERGPAPASDRVGWSELGRDLASLDHAGLRLSAMPVDRTRHRNRCRRTLGAEFPRTHLTRLGSPGDEGPSVAQATLALADMCLPRSDVRPRARVKRGASRVAPLQTARTFMP